MDIDCDNIPHTVDGHRTGTFFSPNSVFNIAQVCCKTLAEFLPPWLLDDKSDSFAVKMLLDGVVAVDITDAANGNASKYSDIVLIKFRKSKNTNSGFFIEKLFPIFVD